MTNSDLQQLFKVDYDKANTITAYPSFLPEEIDYWLNKSYLMTINRKFTGNNPTKIAFEGSNKRIADLQPLVKEVSITTFTQPTNSYPSNVVYFDLSNLDVLYYVDAEIVFNNTATALVELVSHEDAQAATVTSINQPWLPVPVATMADNKLKLFYDINDVVVTANKPQINQLSLQYVKYPTIIDSGKPTDVIEVSDSVCYEIITLAVFLALENIESQRVQTKAQTINLED